MNSKFNLTISHEAMTLAANEPLYESTHPLHTVQYHSMGDCFVVEHPSYRVTADYESIGDGVEDIQLRVEAEFKDGLYPKFTEQLLEIDKCIRLMIGHYEENVA